MATTPTVRIPATNEPTQLAAAGVRSTVMIFNDATTTMYVLCATSDTPAVSATNYTVAIVAGAYWEMPQIGAEACWTDNLWAVWAGSPTGGAQVTVI